MFPKRFFLVFVVHLLITSEITASELASNNEGEVKEAKYAHDAREYYMGGLGVGRFINRKLRQSRIPSYGMPTYQPITGYPVPCCGNKAKATTNEHAADEAQTHN